MEHHHNKQLTIRLRPSPSARSSPTPSAAQTESDDDDNLPNAQELLAMPFGKRADVSPAMKANARNVPVHDHPDGYELRKDTFVRVRGPRHHRSEHAVDYDAVVLEAMVSKNEGTPLVHVRALYSCEDLDTMYIAASSREPDIIRLVQGRHQLVLGDFEEVVYLNNVLKLHTDITRLKTDELSFPVLTHNARWLREDVSVVRVYQARKETLFKVQTVGTGVCHHSKCKLDNFYHPELHPLRYCTTCSCWYHLKCLKARGTIESIREGPRTSNTPSWAVWSPPSHIPADIADDLVRLVTLPVQRGYRGGPPETHPLLSFERFTMTLRTLFTDPGFDLPETSESTETMLQQLLKMSVLDFNERTLREAAAAIRWLADVPLNQRLVYFCPHRDSHSL